MKDQRLFKRVVDLSVDLKSMDTPVFPGAPQPLRAAIQTMERDGYLSYLWALSEHTATHVDAPAHMVGGGESVDRVPLRHFVGNGLVLDFSKKGKRHQITARDIEEALAKAGQGDLDGKGWILLFLTGYTAKSKSKDWLEYPELTKEACDLIIERGFEAVGMDAPGPDRPPFVAHKTLLPKKVVIFENLANLERVKGKRFVFVGAPLALIGGSASPCRAIALVS